MSALTSIPTWHERCETHPDHNGIVTHAMIEARMVEEIADLRAALDHYREQTAAWLDQDWPADAHEERTHRAYIAQLLREGVK